MTTTFSAPVLIVGAGPVGLCLALDLAGRGINSIIAERNPAGANDTVRCNHVSSRTMETFRRLGFADEVRAVGLPDDYPNDVVVRTRATGRELTRIPIPCRRDRFTVTDVPDGWWPTPEPPHRVNQLFFEPILFERAQANPHISILNDLDVQNVTQDTGQVHAQATDLKTGEPVHLTGQFLIGCDGGASSIRRQIGAKLEGDAVIQQVQSTYFRAPELLKSIPTERAWMSYLYIGERAGNLVAIDGVETWLLHNYLLPDEPDFDAVDRDKCLRALLGVDESFEYEVLRQEDWTGRRLVADRFRQDRVFICGDSAHIWVPYAGYGMNTGIADAMNLSWLLAAHLNGWGSQNILDAYEAERWPITDQVSRFAMNHAQKAISERINIPLEIDDDGPEGEVLRAKIGKDSYELHVQQFACAGLNFGYFYPASPLIAYDDGEAPSYTINEYTPSTVPGCRTPHLWLPGGHSLYDQLGPEYTLLRFDREIDIAPLQQAASAANVPLSVLDIEVSELPEPYCHTLLLNRPDHHVAWRGNALPDRPEELIALITGAGSPKQ
ncbi:monooxygenase [Altererythrobacter indicus]|uniref:Monooxygenase n=1 Tax=Altericroceibacterium indicum TaxID=374177 RepID=A0A845AA36_9SPHN|nr:FAD-dependent oxidoreductase [Altericroceibacterium indicum]MXP27110.1 monooxygenase [Altericroceibacterium indicum]